MTIRVSVVVLLIGLTTNAYAEGLKGSKASVKRQYEQVLKHDFTRLPNGDEVRRFVELGLLVKLTGNSNYDVDEYVSHPYVRPATKLFVERVSAQYHKECGEQLVVTSGTRPLNEQPWNASPFSAHPAGMSVDFRISENKSCRRWLEKTGDALETMKTPVLEITREKKSPHYHFTIYSNQYLEYVEEKNKPNPKPVRKAKKHR